MECTQKLECTQEIYYESKHEKICPEQIGFLGICGKKYPVVKGPNKIGRDPQMCNIVLDLKSISRQHAVVNILNNKEFMLMDLDSANKTKLLDKTLKAYIPHPLKNGDTIQFGDVFGIFRLLEEDDDLPMTQAIDIPDTPVPTRQLSKINAITTIPESPDVSDRDDSLVISTQFKGGPQFKSSNEHFIKSSSKTISIQPVGSNKIDNIFWNSSKKSNSFNFSMDNSRKILNNSDTYINNKENSYIHEMETQVPYCNPVENSDSIFEAQTQIPSENRLSESIHHAETQIPSTEHLPEICKIPEQCEMKLNLYTRTNETLLNIHEAETQNILPCEEGKETKVNNEFIKENLSIDSSANETKQKVNISDEELLFDDINESFQDDFESQCLLPKVSLSPKVNKEVSDSKKDESKIEKDISKSKKRVARIESDSSTDCEDLEILPTQKITEIQIDDGDATDCEDILNENTLIKLKTETLANDIRIKVSPGKIVTKNNNIKTCNQDEVPFEEMLTQVIEVEGDNNNSLQDEVAFEDLPTQVIDEVIPNNSERIEYTQQFSEEIISPFKIPLQIKDKIKKKIPSKLVSTTSPKTKPDIIDTDCDNYYQATQDIYEDLCSQKVLSEKEDNNDNFFKKPLGVDGVGTVHSFQSENAGITFEHIENKTLKNSSKIVDNCSKEEDEKVKKFVSSLSKQQIKDVIGVNSASNSKLNQIPSESPDNSTPKKLKPSRLMDIDLPNSQEIKASVHTVTKSLFPELSSDSESENNSEEQYTPILHRKKGKSKTNSKIYLKSKLNLETLPTRVITRVRKPAANFEDGSKKAETINRNILRPNFLTDQDDDIDKEIITENISRLKSKLEKGKSNRVSDSDKRSINNKTEGPSKTLNKVETKDKNKKENKSSNLQETKKKKDLEDENRTNKTKSTRSVRSSKTRHKPESLHKSIVGDENKKEEVRTDAKTNNHNKSQIISNEKNTTTEQVSSTSSSRPTRSSRSKGKSDKRSTTSTLDEEKSTGKPPQKKKEKDNTQDKVLEVRRSTRQKIVKDKKENELHKPGIKSILKRTKINESTVYDISSEFDLSTSRNLKRSAIDDNDAPSPKRTRSSANSSNSLLKSVPTRAFEGPRVLFTAFPADEVKVRLEKLGAVIVTDIMQCNVVLTMQIKRTFKLLCAVGLGRPIVGPNWVQACVDTQMIVDPWLHIINDEVAEKRFAFNLEKTLKGKRNFLEGYNVSSTPSVLPNAAEMKLIVECSGGKWKDEGPRWICVSSLPDKGLWPSLKRRGAAIVTTEFILAGVLKQKVDIETNQFK